MFALFIAWSTKKYNQASQNFLLAFTSFFQDYPALFLGLSSFLAASLTLKFNLFLGGIILVFWILAILKLPKVFASGCILSSLLLSTHLMLVKPSIPESGKIVKGWGIFNPEKVFLSPTYYDQHLKLKGELRYFKTENSPPFLHIPCLLELKPHLQEHLSSNWLIEAELLVNTEKKGHIKKIYSLKPLPGWHLSSLRWKLQKTFMDYIHEVMKEEKVAALYSALICGQNEEKILGLSFSKIGLSHLLAISGFHFNLIASLLLFLTTRLFSKEKALIPTLICLSVFLMFLGLAAPVLRSFVMGSLSYFGKSRFYYLSSLNLFGFALFICCLFLSTSVIDLGFLLTFLCTFALLFSYRDIEEKLERIFPIRDSKEKENFPRTERMLLVFSSFLRKTLSLNLAVFVWSVPALLYFFGSFPLLSLAYNLFIPLIVGLLLSFFLITTLIHPLIGSLALSLHSINNYLTSKTLTLISHPPSLLDFTISFSPSQNAVILYLALLFVWRLISYSKIKRCSY